MLRSNFSIFKISHTNTLYDESWILYEFPSWKYVTIKLRKLVHYGYKGGSGCVIVIFPSIVRLQKLARYEAFPRGPRLNT